MKTKIGTAVGLLLIFAGAMMGNNQNITVCLSLIGLGIVLLVITVSKSQAQ